MLTFPPGDQALVRKAVAKNASALNSRGYFIRSLPSRNDTRLSREIFVKPILASIVGLSVLGCFSSERFVVAAESAASNQPTCSPVAVELRASGYFEKRELADYYWINPKSDKLDWAIVAEKVTPSTVNETVLRAVNIDMGYTEKDSAFVPLAGIYVPREVYPTEGCQFLPRPDKSALLVLTGPHSPPVGVYLPVHVSQSLRIYSPSRQEFRRDMLFVQPGIIFDADLLLQYLNDSENFTPLFTFLRTVSEMRVYDCLSKGFRPIRVTVTDPIGFDGSKPVSGRFILTAQEAGCAPGVVVNILATFTGSGPNALGSLPAGTTRMVNLLVSLTPKEQLTPPGARPQDAGFQLMNRIMMKVRASVEATYGKGPACDKFPRVPETKFISSDEPDPTKPSTWHEEWTFWRCGSFYTVPMEFRQNGASIDVDVGKAIQKPFTPVAQ